MRIKTTFAVGSLIAIGGLVLRVKALDLTQWMAWQLNSSWEKGRREFWVEAWTDIGAISLCAGLGLILVAFHHWIAADRSNESR